MQPQLTNTCGNDMVVLSIRSLRILAQELQVVLSERHKQLQYFSEGSVSKKYRN